MKQELEKQIKELLEKNGYEICTLSVYDSNKITISAKEKEQIDFSEFIVVNEAGVLIIKGGKSKKLLVYGTHFSFMDYDEYFEKNYRKPDYEVIKLSELKPNDVFIKDDIDIDFELTNFKVFIGLDASDDCTYQYIEKVYDIHRLYSTYMGGTDTLVKRFLKK